MELVSRCVSTTTDTPDGARRLDVWYQATRDQGTKKRKHFENKKAEPGLNFCLS